MQERNKKVAKKKRHRRLLSLFLTFAMALSMAGSMSSYAADGTQDGDGSAPARTATAGAVRTADGDTTDAYTLGEPDSTRYDGRVWVDKSVSAEDSVDFENGKTVQNNSDFLVTYSALATSMNTVGQTPTDTVFILDLSASMTWGYDKSGEAVSQDSSRLQAMVDSMNSAIDILVKANPQNRIAIVTFNGTSEDAQALIPNLMTGEDVLQKVDKGNYLEISDYNYTVGKDDGKAKVYCNITNKTASTAGGTNIQSGLFRGMSILANAKDTTADVNGQTVTRVPNVILMSDGAPTTFSSSQNASYVYYNYRNNKDTQNGKRIENSTITDDSHVLREGNNTVYSGSWWETNSGRQIGAGNNNNPDSADGFMALLTASYFKNAISNRYYPNSDKEANVYTIGFGTDVQNESMKAMANLVLNPGDNLGVETGCEQVDEVSEAWDSYTSGNNVIVHAPIGDGSSDLHIPFNVEKCSNENNPTSLNYPTNYYAAENDEDLDQIFKDIANLITSQVSAPTEVTGNPLESGFITYTDTTGQYMEIKDVTTLIFMDQPLQVTEKFVSADGSSRTYEAASYEYDNPAYPGEKYNTTQIKIEVTDNRDHTQTIKVEIPAALIPLRVNTITLDKDGDPINSETTGNLPLRLCYEVGLDEEIDAETLQDVGADYISANMSNGVVNFYSNKYVANSQEADKGVGATVTFEAATTNPFYFIQEDTPLYSDEKGTPATGDFDETNTYYLEVSYYVGSDGAVREETDYVARSGATLAGYVEKTNTGELYIKKGAPRLGNLEDLTAPKASGENKTGTYANYREPLFVYDDPGEANAQEGHFLVLLGNNGKLSVPYLRKDVTTPGSSTSIDGQLVGVGDTLHYTIDWANTAAGGDGSPADAAVTVTDILPAGTSYVGGSAEAYLDTADGSSEITDSSAVDIGFNENTVTWTIQAKAGESGTVSFDVKVEDTAVNNDGNAILNKATIAVGTNTYTTNTTVNYVPEKSVDTGDTTADSAQVGDTLTYTITYVNPTGQQADITITDTLDKGLTFVPGSASDGGSYDEGSRTVTWNLENVPADPQTGTVTFQATVNEDAKTVIKNTAQVQVGHEPAVAVDTNTTETQVETGSLVISKTVQGTNDTSVDFTFTVELTDKNNNPLTGKYEFTGTSDGTTSYTGNVTNDGTVTLRAGGSIEITGLPAGAKYTVTEDPAAGYTPDKAEKTGEIPVNAAAEAAFTNAYSTTSAVLQGSTYLEVEKQFTGKDWTDEEFTFALTQTGGNEANVTLPQNASGISINKDTTDHKAAFGDITFKAPGEYKFEIAEVIPTEPGQITYDTHKMEITVNVTDNGQGALVIQAADVTTGSQVFKNTFTPQSTTAAIQVKKAMAGRELRDSDVFKFTIQPQNGAPATTLTEAQNSKDTVSFGTATFGTEGIYTYLITENEEPTVPGVTNSRQQITATVQVDYDEATGQFSSSVSYTGGDGDAQDTFINTYQAAPVIPAEFEAGITGTKTVAVSDGNAYTMQGGEFSFTLTPDAGNPDSDPIREAVTVSNDKDGNIVFVDGPVTYTEDGEYTYTIREKSEGVPAGISVDDTEYKITVNVKDTGDGQLTAEVTMTKDGNGTDAITFENHYDPAKTSIVISGTKTLEGKTLDDGMFTFQLTPIDGAPMPQSGNTARNTGGTFAFGAIDYTQTGVYHYQVSEVNGGEAEYAYDTTVYDVTVTVTDENGQLKAAADSAENIAFVNRYTPTPVTLTGETALRAHKTLIGRELNEGEFVFQLKDADGHVVGEAANSADGSVVFADLTFDQAGQYIYTISEKANGVGGITYDQTIYTVQIHVTDEGGYLAADVQYYDDQGAGAEVPEFENTYRPASTAVSFGASKTLTGRDLKDGEFTFVLKDGDGQTVAEAKNSADGTVRFDELTFDQTGTYTYTVSEVKGQDANITYDETVYTAVVEVTDGLEGSLVAQVTDADGNALHMTFNNKYNEPAKETPGGTSGDEPEGPGAVRTGDTAPILPAAGAMAAALAVILAMTGTIVRRRRR
ncbi:Spy0128 family protein [Lachnoclostridium phocaeense]|uniref:Spy0128 family protein n=1 Tax=Lachnoclostridium phocaeense TaxID=1871021 RepID=UPI00248E5CBD|nr:FctA domain-containing protein [Lachnoclostridium phocaeense]